MPARECSRTACQQPAISTLTFVYADSTAVLGPLARVSEPNTYDLCQQHAARTTAPRGWELERIPGASGATDDLVALADAVRAPAAPSPPPADPPAAGRHLRVIRSSDD